jgi:hypothetical protein
MSEKLAEARRQMQAAQPQMDRSSAVTDEILLERLRQVDSEGWTPEHDDEHDSFEMTEAATCYLAWTADMRMDFDQVEDILVPRHWPWSRSWWKPKDNRSNLIRAAALLVAEIERLDRAAARVS